MRVASALLLLVAIALVWSAAFGQRPNETAAKGTAADTAAEPAAQRDFEERVAPVLATHCLECHGTTAPKAELDLSRKRSALAGGKNGEVIAPGEPDESLLWEHVDAGRMPPRSRPAMSDDDKRILRDWIAGGAEWPEEHADISRFVPRRGGSNWVRRLTVPEYIETVRAAVGVDVAREARELLPREVRADGFGNTAYNLTVDLRHVEAHAKLAAIVVRRMDTAAFAARFAPRGSSSDANDDALRVIIAGMGRRVLRGPLEEHEIAAYLRLAEAVGKEGGDGAEAQRYVIEAMLQSPRFLYRIEDRPGDHALSSRLSYILWGAPPDEELSRAADAGELSERDNVAAHVRRMLDDPRAVAQSRRFVSEWLHLDRLDSLRPDPKRFPKWDPQLAGDMREETLAYFEEVAWNRDRPLSELMNAQVTFLTPRLAEHYGLQRAASEQANRGGAADAPAPRLVGRATRDLQAFYTFDEGSGTTVRDVSGAGEPLDLTIETPSAVEWQGGRLKVTGSALIATAGPPTRLIDAVTQSQEITLEAWVTPANRGQNGPARILTLSSGISQRNFTLGQEANKYEVRFRTRRSNPNGQPSLDGPTNILYTRPTHIAYTRDAAGKALLYIDGTEQAAGESRGELSNWGGDFRLALANETSGDRSWKGTYHLVALYSRALTPDEVRGNARGPARYDLSAVPARGGLLTQGSTLTIGGDDASTVARGLFVLHELLYSGVDDPPPCVDTTPIPAKPGLSQREIAMQRITNQACAACHTRFETIALGLMKFDGVGGHHERDEHGNTLRDDGEILFPGADRATPFQSSAELMDLLSNSERVGMGITRKATQFALGRPLTDADEPALRAIHAAAREQGGTYRGLMTAIVMSDLVRTTAADEATANDRTSN
ncbi:MAG: DUF1592 domain-containing protein [Planctomycetaceae bacterium]